LTLGGLFLYSVVDPDNPPIWLIGVPPAAVSLIFKAFYGFGLTLDRVGVALGMVTCTIAIMINGDEHISPTSSQVVYPLLLVLGGITTLIDYNSKNSLGDYVPPSDSNEQTAADRRLGYKIGIPLWAGALAFLFWLLLLVSSVTLVNLGIGGDYLAIFEVFFRVGSIIFGGGVVALPMLQNELIPRGWVTNEQFFQGLGLAQSLPGPLFNFGSFLGATYKGIWGAVVAELGLFGPGCILIFAMVPFWSKIRHLSWFKALLKGVNASAIGLIGSGCVFLYANAVKTAADAMVFIIAGGLASFYNVQAPICILVGALAGALFSPAVLDVGQKPYH
jgi:chromate transporter